jgi:hypothetical protein
VSEGQQDLQNKLNECYTIFRENVEFDDNDFAKKLSAPLLIQVTEKWITSKTRVLVVGQETLGWEFFKGDSDYGYDWEFSDIQGWLQFKSAHDSVNALVNAYKIFNFSSNNHPLNHRAPFFSAYRKIRKAVDDDDKSFETSVLWTNLIRMSVNECSVFKNKNATPKQIEKMITASTDVFQDEVKILKPDIVIFFTGPTYDYALNKILYGSAFRNVLDYKERVLAEISHVILPEMAWRTYHPAYLQRSRKTSIIDYLCDQIKGCG